MLERSEADELNDNLTVAWIAWVAMLATLAVYIFISQRLAAEIPPAVENIVSLRTLFYCAAIAIFPLMNLLRRIMLARRPGSGGGRAAKRYLIAFAVSMALSESIAALGLALLMLGDTIQTLYIFVIISAIAMMVYRPKPEEYRQLRKIASRG
ncbi:MAG: hypothetical protein ABFS02_13760 [Pseudomonadota bacterium]